MGRGDDDDFEDDDFSLDDGTEDDNDESASGASVADEEEEELEEEDAGGWSGESDAESDFEGSAPKAKKAKTAKAAPAAKAKKASPASKTKAEPVAKKAPAVKASAAPKSKTTSSPKATTAKSANASTAEKPAAAIKGDPTAYVLDYMRKTNRPYSMLNVFENLHRAIAKPALTKILDNLSDKEELSSKTYGKAKIYYMNQNKLPVPSDDERRDIEDQIKQVEADCMMLDQELKTAEGALASINSKISDADLETMLVQLEEESVALETKLASLERPDRPPIPPGQKDALKRKFSKYRTAWVARKRIVTDAVNQVADGMEKKPKAVYDLIGIETDAEAGIKDIPSI